MRLSGTGLRLIVNAPSSSQLLRSISAAHSLGRRFIASATTAVAAADPSTAPTTTYTAFVPRSCSLSDHTSSPLRKYTTSTTTTTTITTNTQFKMASTLTLPKLPIFEAIASHNPQSTAVVHCLSRRTFKYGEILPDVCRTRDRILDAAGTTDIRGERVAFLIENGYDYVGMNSTIQPFYIHQTCFLILQQKTAC